MQARHRHTQRVRGTTHNKAEGLTHQADVLGLEVHLLGPVVLHHRGCAGWEAGELSREAHMPQHSTTTQKCPCMGSRQ